MEAASIIIHILHVRKQAQKAYAQGPLDSEPAGQVQIQNQHF